MTHPLLKSLSVTFLTAAIFAMPSFARGADAAASDKDAPAAKEPAKDGGAKDAAPATNPENGPKKFYGTITAVDAKAGTFTIDNVTYHVVGESHLTKVSDDSAATIADAVVGEP